MNNFLLKSALFWNSNADGNQITTKLRESNTCLNLAKTKTADLNDNFVNWVSHIKKIGWTESSGPFCKSLGQDEEAHYGSLSKWAWKSLMFPLGPG